MSQQTNENQSFDSNAEFDRAAEELELDNPTSQENVEAEQTAQEQSALETQEQQIEVATQMISQGLRFGIGAFSGVTVDDPLYDQTARAYAVLAAKYFPGGVLGLLDKYKEEVSALSVTLLLAGAVNKAKQEKEAAERKARAEQAEKQKSQPQDNQQKASFSNKKIA